MEKTLDKLHGRYMVIKDHAEVIKIETEAFDYPWTLEELKTTLKSKEILGYIAEKEGQVVGYLIYQLHTSYFEILSLAVHFEHRRTGIGTFLANRLKHKLSNGGPRMTIVVNVFEENLGAQLFFKAIEFKAVKVLKNLHHVEGDSYQMEYRVNE